jgi:hypothetical protein
MNTMLRISIASCLLATSAAAQAEYAKTMHQEMHPPASAGAGGQYAFVTIGEVVRILKADQSTDWTKVNLEALRQHLIDMDDVMLRAVVVQRNVPGGVQLDITGTGRTAAAIKRMVTSHAHVLGEHTPWQPTVRNVTGGVRLTVLAKDTTSASAVAMLRGLGFAGIMVEGDHHAEHHLMMARGMSHH